MTIPSPSVMHFRGGRKAISKQVYPDMDAFFDDLAKALRQGDQGLLRRRLPLPAARRHGVGLSLLRGAAGSRRARAARTPTSWPASTPGSSTPRSKAKPADMTITTHVCRGNFRSTWISEGGYEPVAELLLGGIDYDGYFLEYDTERAGGLRAAALPAQGQEARGGRPRHLQERRRWRRRTTSSAGSTRRPSTPRSTSCASRPQCGFASTEEGNVLTEDAAVGQAQDDRRYLQRGVEVAVFSPCKRGEGGRGAPHWPQCCSSWRWFSRSPCCRRCGCRQGHRRHVDRAGGFSGHRRRVRPPHPRRDEACPRQGRGDQPSAITTIPRPRPCGCCRST